MLILSEPFLGILLLDWVDPLFHFTSTFSVIMPFSHEFEV